MSTGIRFDGEAARGLEAMYRTPDVVGQRSQVLAALALAPGERVLDVGFGPGLLTWDMALCVGPEGRVCGIDSSEAMLAAATRRCAEQPWTELRLGDATSLPWPDASFDAVVSTQVYEYVEDLDRALAEAARVLRSGGRLLVLDTDWDTAVWNTADPGRLRRVLDAWEAHLHDPRLPRSLGPRLEAAGLRVVRREVIPIVNPTYHPNCFSWGITRAIRAFVSERGGVSEAEARAWAEELKELAERGEYFFSLNRYLFGALRTGSVGDGVT